jgi:hypothetical protein
MDKLLRAEGDKRLRPTFQECVTPESAVLTAKYATNRQRSQGNSEFEDSSHSSPIATNLEGALSRSASMTLVNLDRHAVLRSSSDFTAFSGLPPMRAPTVTRCGESAVFSLQLSRLMRCGSRLAISILALGFVRLIRPGIVRARPNAICAHQRSGRSESGVMNDAIFGGRTGALHEAPSLFEPAKSRRHSCSKPA